MTHRARSLSRWTLASSMLALAACGGSTVGSANPTANGTTVRPQGDPLRAPDTRAERLVFKRFHLALDLPDPKGWHPAHRKSRFVELDHDATGSTLVVRAWVASDRMTPTTCEAEARLYRDFPSGGELLTSEPRAVAGFTSTVKVGIVTVGKPADAHLAGYVTAFGAKGRECLAFAFATEALGPDARTALEERLALFDQRTLNSVRPVEPISPLLRESRAPSDTAPP